MRLIRFRRFNEGPQIGAITAGGIVPIPGHQDLLTFVQSPVAIPDICASSTIPLESVTPLLPYDVPPKIWCIGLNYRSHAEDIDAVQPEEPGSFMKPASCMFPPGGEIVLPPAEVSNEVDAEGELGLIIGKQCRFLDAAEAQSAIFGYTT